MTVNVDLPVVGRTAPGASRAEVIAHIAEGARLIRMKDLANVVNAGQGHIGGEFSIIDVLATLYLHEANITADNLDDPDRDRVILSKGHAANALYTTFAAAGLLEAAELDTFVQPGSRLNGHPARTKVPGVEANTGPLGHGLPIAVGDALAAKIDGSPRRVLVLTGDGELQEGSNWEALMAAAQFELDNLIVVADRNHIQQGATTEDANDLSPWTAKSGPSAPTSSTSMPTTTRRSSTPSGPHRSSPAGRGRPTAPSHPQGAHFAPVSRVTATVHNTASPAKVLEDTTIRSVRQGNPSLWSTGSCRRR